MCAPTIAPQSRRARRQAALPGPIALPDRAGVLLASAPLEDGRLPAHAAAWLRTA
jgi:hypothetical protein